MKKKKIMLGILPKSAWLLLLIPAVLFLTLAHARPAAAILTKPVPAQSPPTSSNGSQSTGSNTSGTQTSDTGSQTSTNGVEPKQTPDACNINVHPNLDATAQQSCACTDNTNPNLTAEEVKTCQTCKSGDQNNCLAHNVIIQDLNKIIKFLSAAVGVIVVADIILGGIQFGTATEGSEQVQKAKQRITRGVTALIVFMFIFAFIQWIIPGGLFNT